MKKIFIKLIGVIRRYFIKHRGRLRELRIAAIVATVVAGYTHSVHYDLVLPLSIMWFLVELKKWR